MDAKWGLRATPVVTGSLLNHCGFLAARELQGGGGALPLHWASPPF